MAPCLGVPDELVPRLREVLREATPEERLAVCLYFQRDLPIELQSLDRIEADLRKIFPRGGNGRIRGPDDYADFQASAIRFVFNSEKRTGRSPRLFDSPARGRWRTTAAGNRLAEALLARHGLAEVMRPAPSTEDDGAGAQGLNARDLAGDSLELRIDIAEFVGNADALIARIRDTGESVLLTVHGHDVAEVVPVYSQPPAELAGSVLWEAEDAFEPQPELWNALR